MKLLHLPEIAHRHVQSEGTKAGNLCRRPMPSYHPGGLLAGWDPCLGLMQRRNGRQKCMKCGRAAQ